MENLDLLFLSKSLQKIESVHKNLVKNYFYGIYDRDTYNALMKKLKNISDEINSLNISDIYSSIKTENLAKKIKTISLEMGCLNIFDIIEYNYSEWFKNNLDNLIEFDDINFYNTHFNCLSYKIIKRGDKDYDELHKVNKKIFLKNDNSIRYKKSLLERLNSAELVISIEKKNYLDYDNEEFLVIYGYFDNNNLCVTKNNNIINKKVSAIKFELSSDNKINRFKLNYLNIIGFKDLIIDPLEKILEDLTKAYNEYNIIKNKNTSVKVKDFLMGSLPMQRDMLNYMICSEEEDDLVIANLLFDSINKNTELTRFSPSSDELFKSLNYTIQEKLKDAFKTFDILKKKIVEDHDIDIPYDKRILLMNCTDSIKKKAFTKLKEMDGSKESSTKAQLYLDGLLKLPFGVYKKEPIFGFREKFLLDLDGKISYIRNKNSKFKLDLDNISIIKLFTNIDTLVESYDKNKIKHDSEIEKFLKVIYYTWRNNSEILSKADDNTSPHNNEMINIIIKHHQKYTSNKNYKPAFHEINILLEKIINDWANFVKNKTKYLSDIDSILDQAVYGHKQTKQELKRLIGQWISGKIEGNVIGLCGPPGVGKTSFAKRGLSKCLQDDKGQPRPFAFLPIGGATNGSFLEGHGYTYLGSTWGKIADILMEAGCMNPIIFIDELDKVSNTEHGREIIGILTHITDPTQNNEYYDKFFQGIPLDLSKALFIFSYNDKSLVDRILRDRIHEINIKSLTKEEKVYITNNYTFPEMYNNIGFNSTDILWEKDVIDYMIETYTHEAGIRKLNELLNIVLREINLERIKNPEVLPKLVDINYIENLFSEKPKIKPQIINSEPKVGLINGLYASASGLGGLTVIEVVKSVSDAKLNLELTGSQGDVMKESMKVAKTLSWNIIPNFIKQQIKEEMETFGNYGLHIHCPDGATPKDGPSAGGAITVAIISRLCNIRIRNDLCMTGEINLSGKFTAIGGLDAKLKGGEKAGCKIAIIPKENEEDYNNILKDYKLDLDVKIVDNIYDVLKYAFIEEDIKKYNIEFNKI
jgi:ATP-dependent Lon protease